MFGHIPWWGVGFLIFFHSGLMFQSPSGGKWGGFSYDALLGAGVTIGIFLITTFGTVIYRGLKGLRFRKNRNIPNIITEWEGNWYLEDGSEYATNDRINLVKWLKDGKFRGHGGVIFNRKNYKYSITGEITPTRFVMLEYKAENYPTEGNVGVAFLFLNQSAETMEGYWTGTVSTDNGTRLANGKVKLERSRNI